jgi:hypothetical protein
MLSDVIQAAKVGEFKASEDGYIADALTPFIQWCNSKGQKYCPTTPIVVAAFVTDVALVLSEQDISNALRAAELLHDQFNYANPVATAAVRKAWSRIVAWDAPRGWSKEDLQLFKTVSPEVQSIIARRERERDKALRQAQNKLADEIKRLKTDGAATKPVELKEKETQHGV